MNKAHPLIQKIQKSMRPRQMLFKVLPQVLREGLLEELCHTLDRSLLMEVAGQTYHSPEDLKVIEQAYQRTTDRQGITSSIPFSVGFLGSTTSVVPLDHPYWEEFRTFVKENPNLDYFYISSVVSKLLRNPDLRGIPMVTPYVNHEFFLGDVLRRAKKNGTTKEWMEEFFNCGAISDTTALSALEHLMQCILHVPLSRRNMNEASPHWRLLVSRLSSASHPEAIALAREYRFPEVEKMLPALDTTQLSLHEQTRMLEASCLAGMDVFDQFPPAWVSTLVARNVVKELLSGNIQAPMGFVTKLRERLIPVPPHRSDWEDIVRTEMGRGLVGWHRNAPVIELLEGVPATTTVDVINHMAKQGCLTHLKRLCKERSDLPWDTLTKHFPNAKQQQWQEFLAKKDRQEIKKNLRRASSPSVKRKL